MPNWLSKYWSDYFVESLRGCSFAHYKTLPGGNGMCVDRAVSYIPNFYPSSVLQLLYHIWFFDTSTYQALRPSMFSGDSSSPLSHGLWFWHIPQRYTSASRNRVAPWACIVISSPLPLLQTVNEETVRNVPSALTNPGQVILYALINLITACICYHGFNHHCV